MNYPGVLSFDLSTTTGKPCRSLVDEYKVFEEIQKAQNYALLIESRRTSLKKRDTTHNLSNNPHMQESMLRDL